MNDQDAFERAFVAATYMLGLREGLERGLGPAPAKSALDLARALLSGTKPERARTLAGAILPIVGALEARRFS